jgi:hypothetical protein
MAGYPPTYRWSDLEWAEAWADKQANPRGSWSGAGINAMNTMVRAVTPCAAEYMAAIAANSLDANKPTSNPTVRVIERWAQSNRLTDYNLKKAEWEITNL